MSKKWFEFSIFVVALLVVLPGAVMAQEDDNLHGTGRIHAEGKGVATLIGQGQIHITGDGSLYIVDRAGDASIEISGTGTRSVEEVRGHQVIHYRGFDGEATIRGSRIGVRLRGKDIVLDAEGRGVVRLRGEGWYVVGDQEGEWSANGVNLRLGETKAPTNTAGTD